MSDISIHTSQNIAIFYPKASIGERILAWLMDFVLTFSFVFLVLLVIQSSGLPEQLYLLITPALFYHLLFELFNNGQSVGKKIFHIKVVRLDGASPSLGSYLIRWIFRIIENGLFLFGSIPMLTYILSGKGQRLGDIIAGTTVVCIKEKATIGDSVYEDIPVDYEPLFSKLEVGRLKEKEIRIIKRYLRSNVHSSQPHTAEMTASKVKKATGIETNARPIAFLKQIVKDYNYYNQKE